MKRSIAITCMMLALTPAAKGQWMQTSGPEGAPVTAIAADDAATIAIINQDVYRRTGDTWQQVGTLRGHQGQGIATPSNHPLLLVEGVLLANTPNGVLRSTDYGGSWSRADVDGSIFTDGQHFYAKQNDSLLFSEDGGVHWALRGMLPAFTSEPVFSGGSMVAMNGFFGDALIRSTDGGSSWDTVQTDLTGDFGAPRDLFAGPDGLYAIVGTGRVFRSTDAGRHWTAFASGLEGVPSGMAVATGQELLIPTTEGLFSFSNGTWKEVDVTRVYHVAMTGKGVLVGSVDGAYRINTATLRGELLGRMPIRRGIANVMTAGNALLASTFEGLYRSTDRGASWTWVHEMQPWELVRHGGATFAIAGGLYRSTDDGATWESFTERLGTVGTDVVSMVSSGDDLYVGLARTFGEHGVVVWNSGGVLRSTDGGESWREVNSGLPFRGGVAVPIVDMTVTENGLLVNTGEGLFRSSSGLGGWSPAMNGLPVAEENRTLGVFMRLHGTLYLVTGYGIHTSSNDGLSWSPLSTPVPIEDEYRWSASLWNTDEYFYTNTYKWMGGNDFAYKLLRFHGSVWEDITATQPDGVLLQGFARMGSDLYAGSASHGVWRLQMPSSVDRDPSAAAPAAIHPNPASDHAAVRFTLPAQAVVRMTLIDMLGREVMRLDAGMLGAGEHEQVLDLAKLPAGSYLLRLHGGDYAATVHITRER